MIKHKWLGEIPSIIIFLIWPYSVYAGYDFSNQFPDMGGSWVTHILLVILSPFLPVVFIVWEALWWFKTDGKSLFTHSPIIIGIILTALAARLLALKLIDSRTLSDFWYWVSENYWPKVSVCLVAVLSAWFIFTTLTWQMSKP